MITAPELSKKWFSLILNPASSIMVTSSHTKGSFSQGIKPEVSFGFQINHIVRISRK
jgi:hypothetical protein